LLLRRLAGDPGRVNQIPRFVATPAQARQELVSMYGVDFGLDVKAWRAWIHLRPMPDFAAHVRTLAPRLLPLLQKLRPAQAPLVVVYSRDRVRKMLVKAFGVDFKFDAAAWQQWLDEHP
jgi:hypothetical protein